MFITLTTGRAIFASSIKVGAPRFTNHALQTTKPMVASGIAANAGLQPVRMLSRTNETLARFGTRSKPEHVDLRETANLMRNYGVLTLGVAGAAGIGALCYYGLGLSNQGEGALERSMLWPECVRNRIHSTYAHLGAGFGISAAAAYATLKSPTLMRFFSSGSVMGTLGIMGALIVSHMAVDSIPYEPGLGVKQLAWTGHSSLLGMVLAPLSLYGGPALIRAAIYTAGIVGGLSAIAVCAPSEKFLTYTAPLSIGLGAVVASSIGSLFLPPTSRIGLGLYGIAVYGGLVVFSGLLLYDTQKIIKKAELHPRHSMAPYDPISNSMHLYMDILNIFIRMVRIVAMGGHRN